jgi:hypothetical protein
VRAPAPFGDRNDLLDVALLLERYHAKPSASDPRRPPWNWAVLAADERDAQHRLLHTFVDFYNHTYAVTEDDVIPPCWPHHPGLVHELAAHLWLWYATFLDDAATAFAAADYYLRHLPGLRQRLTHYLGRSPAECRQGHHPDTWRRELDSIMEIT